MRLCDIWTMFPRSCRNPPKTSFKDSSHDSKGHTLGAGLTCARMTRYAQISTAQNMENVLPLSAGDPVTRAHAPHLM